MLYDRGRVDRSAQVAVAKPKFTIGQIVHHRLFGYRGVVIDIDLVFELSDEWYEQVAKTRPPKDQPWYRVLVGDAVHETYVAERHLEADSTGNPIDHPLVSEFFDDFEDGHYVRSRSLN